MKEILKSSKLELRKSGNEWRVFAKEDIDKNEILEEIPFLPMDNEDINVWFKEYGFYFQNKGFLNYVIPVGFACYYNQVKNDYNAVYKFDDENQIFVFSSISLIKTDEEICIPNKI